MFLTSVVVGAAATADDGEEETEEEEEEGNGPEAEPETVEDGSEGAVGVGRNCVWDRESSAEREEELGTDAGKGKEASPSSCSTSMYGVRRGGGSVGAWEMVEAMAVALAVVEKEEDGARAGEDEEGKEGVGSDWGGGTEPPGARA